MVDTHKGVGRKISREGPTETRPKISTIKPLSGGGAMQKKTEK